MTNVLPFPHQVGFLERAARLYRELQAAALLKLTREGRLRELAEGPIDPEPLLTEAEYLAVVDDFNRRHPLPRTRI